MSAPEEKETGHKPRVGDGTPGPGRPKGVPNKATTAVKTAIMEAAEQLGGTDRLAAWAKEDPANERAFWATIYPKLLPKELTGAEGADLFPKDIRVIGVKPG